MGKIQISDGENPDELPDENSEPEEFDAQNVNDESKPTDDGDTIPVTKKVPAAKQKPAKVPDAPYQAKTPPVTDLTPKPVQKNPAPVPSSLGPMTQSPNPSPQSSGPSIEPPDDEQNVFEAASHAAETDPENNYSQYTPLRKPPKKWPKILLWIFVSLFAVAGVGAAGYMIYKQKNHSKPQAQTSEKQSSSHTNPNQNSNQSDKSSSPAPGTKSYTSDNLKLSFDYPDNWTVVDAGSGKLTVSSQPQQLTDASGQKVNGRIIMEIDSQSSADMSDFKTGPATAVLKSQKIDYSHPTGTQRANTYISFVQYNTTTTKGGMDGIYVTGDLGYDYAQPIKESDIQKIDPLVRVVFVKCSDDKCTTSTKLTISSTMWSDSSLADPITNMLKSLSFQ